MEDFKRSVLVAIEGEGGCLTGYTAPEFSRFEVNLVPKNLDEAILIEYNHGEQNGIIIGPSTWAVTSSWRVEAFP